MFIKRSNFLPHKLPNPNICSFLFGFIYHIFILLVCICLYTLALDCCRLCTIAIISKVMVCILTYEWCFLFEGSKGNKNYGLKFLCLV